MKDLAFISCCPDDEIIWRFIPNFEIYEISNNGQVRNTQSGKILKNQLSKQTGYLQVTLHNKGIKYRANVHRLVAENFIQNTQKLPVTNHKDGNKQNNYYLNLEWSTQSNNVLHALEMGISQRGSKKSNAKLKENDVIAIRNSYLTRLYSQNDLALDYKVSRSVIKDIVNQRTWKHLLKN